jgi:hypothetical protein
MVDIEKLYKVDNDWGWVTHFEIEMAKYCGSHFALAVDSNTNAIKLLFEYLNIKNQKIFVPKNTYVSVPSQIIHSGNIPYFIDLEWEGEYQLYPYPIWDSATRFRKNMHKTGTYQILSFHLKKILNIGTGGMILTEDREFIEWARPKIYDGRDFKKMYADDDFQCIGYHMYMTPEQAKRGLEIFHSDKITDDNSDCGSYKTYKDLTKQLIFKDYVNVSTEYKGVKILNEKIYDINNSDIFKNHIVLMVNNQDHIPLINLNMDDVLNISQKTIELLKNTKNVFFAIIDRREGNESIPDNFWNSIIDFRKKYDIPYEKIVVISNNNKIYNKDVKTIAIPFYLIDHRMNASIKELELNRILTNGESIVLKSDLDDKKIRDKRFLSYNRSGFRWHRSYMLSKLYKFGILDNTIFSFYESQYFNNKNKFGDLDYIPSIFETLEISLEDKWDILKFLSDKCPTMLDHNTSQSASGGHNYFSKKEHYLDTYISIVNETGINDNTTFITEKTVRPMFNRHPFIVWGNPHILKTLRYYGFKTFDWLVDESYDECENANDRFNMILEEIKKINSIPIDKLHSIYYENIDTMEHNYQRLKEMKDSYKLGDILMKKLI